KSMVDSAEIGVRLYVMVADSVDSMRLYLDDYRMEGYGDNHLTVRSIKGVMDGALGSHGAWLLEPYDDMPSSSGLNTNPLAEIAEVGQLAAEHDFQYCIHAIGDRGNREVLDIYQNIFNAFPQKDDLRWRIEHAQHLNPRDINRFSQMGVIASMQGVHCTSDGPWVPKRIGDSRAEEGAYVWRKLLKTNAMIINGTDAPVEDVDPLASFFASVTRKLSDGTPFYPGQCMTRYEALQSYTSNSAYAAFEENIKGSLTVGKLADITVLSEDILTVSEDKIPGTEIMYTIVGGNILFRHESMQ
ncbi:MAG: amidohydrolase family protein, partial [candidate division Zixibacteria bacterium]